MVLEVTRESRGGIYLTIEEVALHGVEPVEIVISDQVFYQAGDLIPARPDSVVEMRQGPSGPGSNQTMVERKKTRTKKIRERTIPKRVKATK